MVTTKKKKKITNIYKIIQYLNVFIIIKQILILQGLKLHAKFYKIPKHINFFTRTKNEIDYSYRDQKLI